MSAWALLWLGYPDQAQQRNHEALALAQDLPRPFERAYSFFHTAIFHLYRREGAVAQALSEEAIALATNMGLSMILAWATITRGWTLAEQGKVEEGIVHMRQGLGAFRATGAELSRPTWLWAMAEAYGKIGQVEEGLSLLAEALETVNTTGECLSEAEMYRLRGELTLQQSKAQGAGGTEQEFENLYLQSKILEPRFEAEECFLKAIEIARKQQAKSLELRATTSLARLWQQQDKRAEAHHMLFEIYGWFTEGFDTKDLQEARGLIEELREDVIRNA